MRLLWNKKLVIGIGSYRASAMLRARYLPAHCRDIIRQKSESEGENYEFQTSTFRFPYQ